MAWTTIVATAQKEINRQVSEIDFLICTISVWEPPSGNRYVQRRYPAVLETISSPTVGRHYTARDQARLTITAELISREIRNQYVLAYKPLRPSADGKFHKVRVRVEPVSGQALKLSYRNGYYASRP